jgi:hypothetical protein
MDFAMKRQYIAALASVAVIFAVAAMSAGKKPGLLLLDWTTKAPVEAQPVAILIELGVKDDKPLPWPGRAAVIGAKVVKREGYRFNATDKLVEPDGWEASTYRTGRAPQSPAATKLMRLATVGVVLHLTDIAPDAAVTLELKNKGKKIVVPLQDVLAGKNKVVSDGAVIVRLVSTASPVVSAPTEDDYPAAARGPDGTLWVAYISYTRKGAEDNVNFRQIKKQPANFKAYDQPGFADQLWVKYLRQGVWSEPIAITDGRQDLMRCALAIAGDGTAWVAYSADRQGNFDIYARPVAAKFSKDDKRTPAPGPEQRLTKSPGPDLNPVMCTDQQGRPWLACQSWDELGQARINLFRLQGEQWQEGPALPGRPLGENCWSASLAAGPAGQVALAYDIYRNGDYDVLLAVIDRDRVTEHVVAGSSKFEARPSVAYDAQNRLWIAFEEGPTRWGKDFGALDVGHGNPLYSKHSVHVACLQGGKLLEPVATLPVPKMPADIPGDGNNFIQYEYSRRYSHPRLGLDGKGRVWLSYRQHFGTPFNTYPGSTWLTLARRLDGDRWTDPVEVHHSDGLLDHRPVMLPQPDGGLLIVHNTDGRYTTPALIDNQIYASVINLPGGPMDPKLVPRAPGTRDDKAAAQELAAVKRIRAYRAEVAGKKYQLLRGEFHRHTEISFDGGSDGSLEDMFRYAIDAAGMDWIGNGDHDAGSGREYTWWIIQKYTDAYHVKNVFTPMFTYERSVGYPHGHRNCVFARRGIRVLPRLAEPNEDKKVATVHADDAKMLYRYLKEFGGICASHTSATNMGTDWRDHDKDVEPIVEIYQGDRMSYEYEGAPRSGYENKSGKTPVNIGGWYPKGFINLALEKGIRLGFQASSDHHSTHISYCITLAERNDRESILAAMRQRHCYAATDDIILDVRSGQHMMGDEFKTAVAPTLDLTVIGTRDLAAITILRDSAVVATIKPAKSEYRGTWTDPNPAPGVHYYYVRVQQTDDQLAWGSPMWIDYAR